MSRHRLPLGLATTLVVAFLCAPAWAQRGVPPRHFAPGVVKLKQGGGAAGNNGIKDLIAQLGSNFWRLRLGVGKPPAAGIEHVLSRPSAAEERAIRECIAQGIDAVPIIIEQGGQRAMSSLHTRAAPPAATEG